MENNVSYCKLLHHNIGYNNITSNLCHNQTNRQKSFKNEEYHLINEIIMNKLSTRVNNTD